MTPYLLALILARSLDAASSAYALHQPGLAEGVPWMPQTVRGQIVVQAGLTTGQAWCYARIGRTHPKVARGLSLLQIGTSGAAVTVNVFALRTIARRRS